MVKEKMKKIINKENVKKLASNKKYISWAVVIVLAFLLLNFFGFTSSDYCSRPEVIDVVSELANEIGAKITAEGAEKIARDGKIYYCQAPITNKKDRVLKYTVHLLDEGFWAELGHKFQ